MIFHLIVLLVDIVLINLLFAGAACLLHWIPAELKPWVVWNVSYFVSVIAFKPYAQLRNSKTEQVAVRSLYASILMVLMALLTIWVDPTVDSVIWKGLVIFICTYITMFLGRLCSRSLIKGLRRKGIDNKVVVFVGAGHNLAYLYDCMMTDLSIGYKVLGYFEDQPSTHLPEKLERLGKVNQVIEWLQNNHVDSLYCNLPSSRSAEIVEIINFCDKHFIHFYSVPNVRNYIHRAMEVEMVEDMPVLTLRNEPLQIWYNRLFKRAFDILVSFIFIVGFFWWIYIIVAIITKITMPGPVLFKQKRNGILGEEFTCLKFRSMKVNADADRLQATKDDPRKTKWGDIMRKTNIDELPQFLNVLMGDMSIVGPRPHMLLHTEEYSALIDKYMLRHWVKPGITGWAQVTGARGETHELWQMEERIKKDIWYIENWSPYLDIKIMIKTVTNIFKGDKQAY